MNLKLIVALILISFASSAYGFGFDFNTDFDTDFDTHMDRVGGREWNPYKKEPIIHECKN